MTTMTNEQRDRMDRLIWRLKNELREKQEQYGCLAIDINYLTVQLEMLYEFMGYEKEGLR